MSDELLLPSIEPLPPTPRTPDGVMVKINRIAKNPRYQVRNRLDVATISHYARCMANGADFPPVELADINGSLFIVNGWHRLEAAAINDQWWIEATIKPMTHAEALRAAALGNSTHGKPLKASELRNSFKAFVRGRGHLKPDKSLKSYREIAQELGGHNGHTTIRNWMQKDFPRIAKEMGGNDAGNPRGEPPRIDQQREIHRATMMNVSDALALYGALTDPADRSEVIERMESALAEMKTKEHEPLPF